MVTFQPRGSASFAEPFGFIFYTSFNEEIGPHQKKGIIMIQGIFNFMALIAVLMLGAGILLIGISAMAAVYGCVFAKDDDEKFTIGVDFGRRHADAEERAIDICEGMVNKYNRLMDALISQYTEEDENNSSNFTLV